MSAHPLSSSRHVSMGQLLAMAELHLAENQLTAVPAALGALTSLKTLGLRHNLLTVLPAEFCKLKALTELTLQGNPITVPPPEIVAQGVVAVRDHLCKLLNQHGGPQ